MVSIGDLFGKGSIAEQFLIYGVLQQVAAAALVAPLSDVQQAVNSADPVFPLTPQEAAVAVVRGFMSADQGQGEAAKSGIGPGRFEELTQLAASPPALGLLLEAYRRSLGDAGGGATDGVDLDQALVDLGISAQYRTVVKQLAINLPTQEDVFSAWLEGQITEGEATARLLATGLDPSWITPGYNTRGQAPTPVEGLEMLNRGLIAEEGDGPDSTSWHQAFLEGPWRNKWAAAFLGLRYYLPPPRTVTAMLKEGALTNDQAAKYLADQGLDPTLTAIYLTAASHHTSAAQKALSQAQITGLYEDQLITFDQAVADLVALKFTDPDARLILALSDHKLAAAAVKSATTRLRTLFLSGKNDAAATSAALHTLGLTDDQVANLIATWGLEQASATRTLSEAQVIAAWNVGLLGPDSASNTQNAMARLEGLGYDSDDALILIQIKNGGPLT